jgi:DNA polymerase III delta prime subunit
MTTSEFGGYKIVIIDSAEDMNISSANSILKTLEEPKGQAVIILTTNKLFSLLATIRSRCQKIFVNSSINRNYSIADKVIQQWIRDLDKRGEDIQVIEEQRNVFLEFLLDYSHNRLMNSLLAYEAKKYLNLSSLIEKAKNTYLDHQSLVKSCISII